MKNFVQEGKVLDHVLAAVAVSGGVVALPAGIGIATVSGEIGEKIALAVEGVVRLPKKAATVMAFGAKVAWDSTPGEITTVLADGVACGMVSKAALSADTQVEVKLIYGIDAA